MTYINKITSLIGVKTDKTAQLWDDGAITSTITTNVIQYSCQLPETIKEELYIAFPHKGFGGAFALTSIEIAKEIRELIQLEVLKQQNINPRHETQVNKETYLIDMDT